MNTVTVTRIRLSPGAPPVDPLQVGRDRHGDPLPSPPPSPGSSPREVHTPIRGVVLGGATTSTETQTDRDVVAVERVLYLPAPPGPQLRSSDVVEVPGDVDPDGRPRRWRVHGEPAPLPRHAFTGTRFRTRVTVRRVE